MEDGNLLVAEFSKENLVKCLASNHAPPDEVAGHNHLEYLLGYLDRLGARTILVEDPYVDGDYLDDYSVYYAKCFTDYGRWAKRLHFFDVSLKDADITPLMQGANEDEVHFFQQHYLGFSVARPLPEAVVGRTVLKTYDDDNHRRFYPATIEYRANLCGTSLSIKSLAFQEQDTVLAACATVALWSAFHKTAELFHTPIPTPASITRAASQAIHYGRPIPSSGLQVEEMCTAIRHLELEPELIDLRSGGMVPFASLIYGYLSMGLPVLLIIDIGDSGLHAVTVTGFSVLDAPARQEEVPGHNFPPLTGRRIDRIYAHDDQIGPFSRMILRDGSSSDRFPVYLETSWKDAGGHTLQVFPYAVVVPVYHKIRLRFTDVIEWLTPLDAVFSDVIPEGSEREWDVQLTLSNYYKERVRLDASRTTELKSSILMAHHPRFWWRAAMKIGGQEVVELLFDATGIARSLKVSTAVWLSESYARKLREELSNPSNKDVLVEVLGSDRLLQFLLRSIDHRSKPFDH